MFISDETVFFPSFLQDRIPTLQTAQARLSRPRYRRRPPTLSSVAKFHSLDDDSPLNPDKNDEEPQPISSSFGNLSKMDSRAASQSLTDICGRISSLQSLLQGQQQQQQQQQKQQQPKLAKLESRDVDSGRSSFEEAPSNNTTDCSGTSCTHSYNKHKLLLETHL